MYLYEFSAKKPERRNLAAVRKGEYEALEEKLQQPEWAPDYGPAEFNAKAGGTVTGARKFLKQFFKVTIVPDRPTCASKGALDLLF